MTTIRVAIIHNIMTPYRTVLFDAIADHPDINLHVFYCSKSYENRNWEIADSIAHKHSILLGPSVETNVFKYHVNPTIITKLVSDRFDVAIIGGGTHFTMQLGYLVSKYNLNGTILWTERISPPEYPFGKLINPIIKQMSTRADSLIIPTSKARKYQIEQGISEDKIFTAPNVVDSASYYRNKTNRDQLKILFVGQLIERKGVDYLLDAYSQLDQSNIELTIVGDGPKEVEYKRKAETTSLNVTFTGWVSENEKRRLFADADLFVLPSIKDLAPLVLNEALASGLPIITTDAVGNAPDMIIDGGNGNIVPAGDSSALADALINILDDHDELVRMGDRSERIMEELFLPASVADRFADAVKYSIT